MKILRKYSFIVATFILQFSPSVDAAKYSEQNKNKPFITQEEINSQIEYAKKDKYQKLYWLMQSKRFNLAGNELNRLLKDEPSNAKLYNLQALLHIFQGNKGLAEKSYQRAIQYDVENLTANLGLARIFLEKGALIQAKKMVNTALVTDNKNINAYLVLADIVFKKEGGQDESEQLLKEGYKHVKGNINSEIKLISALGKLYANQQQPEKLLPLANGIAERYPDDYRALSVLAGAQIVNNQRKLAESTLKKIISLKQDDINHRLMLINVISKEQKKEDEILTILDKILSLRPAHTKSIVLKNAYLLKKRRFQEAIGFAQTVEKDFPNSSLGKQLQGDVLLAEKKLDLALNAYEESYNIQPISKVLNLMVNILQHQGKQEVAIKLLQEKLNKNINPTEIHLKLAEIYNQLNNSGLVEKHYKAVLELQPNNISALNNLAWHYKEQNNLDKAKIIATKAFSLAPKIPPVVDTYAYILLKQGELKQALSLLEGIADASPQELDIQSHLAEAYLLNGNKKQSLTVMNNLINKAKNNKDKQAAILYLETLKNK